MDIKRHFISQIDRLNEAEKLLLAGIDKNNKIYIMNGINILGKFISNNIVKETINLANDEIRGMDKDINDKWISAETVKDLLSKGRLKINYDDYGKLYNMQVKCYSLWDGSKLSGSEIEELKKLDIDRTNLHGKITNDVIKDNNLDVTKGIYDSVRRGIALMMEEDYNISLKNNIEAKNNYNKYWIDPNGKVYEIKEQQHSTWVMLNSYIVRKTINNDLDLFDELKEKSTYGDLKLSEFIIQHGWTRIREYNEDMGIQLGDDRHLDIIDDIIAKDKPGYILFDNGNKWTYQDWKDAKFSLANTIKQHVMAKEKDWSADENIFIKPMNKEKVTLKDGEYEALWYVNTMEIVGGEYNEYKFKTRIGVKCQREFCGPPRLIIVNNGNVWLEDVYNEHIKDK